MSERLEQLAQELASLEERLDLDPNWRALRELERRVADSEIVPDLAKRQAALVAELCANPAYFGFLRVRDTLARLRQGRRSTDPVPLAGDHPAVEPPAVSSAAGGEDATEQLVFLSPPAGSQIFRARIKLKKRAQPRAPSRDRASADPTLSFVAAEPASEDDDLTRIRGINRALAARLREHGVTRLADIAGWYRADIDRISSALGLGRLVFRTGWIEQAAKLSTRPPHDAPPLPAAPAVTVEARSAGVPEAPPQQASPAGSPPARIPLELIRGIDRKRAWSLMALGVNDARAIASWTAADVGRFALALPGARIAAENWIEQAAVLAAGRDTKFARRQRSGALAALVDRPLPEAASGQPSSGTPGAATGTISAYKAQGSHPPGSPQGGPGRIPNAPDTRPAGLTTAAPSSLSSIASAFEPSTDPEPAGSGTRTPERLAERLLRLEALRTPLLNEWLTTPSEPARGPSTAGTSRAPQPSPEATPVSRDDAHTQEARVVIVARERQKLDPHTERARPSGPLQPRPSSRARPTTGFEHHWDAYHGKGEEAAVEIIRKGTQPLRPAPDRDTAEEAKRASVLQRIISALNRG